MDNQQPSTLEERIYTLGKNAIFGDGYLWKHPECKNYKIIYTSVTPELLEIKRRMAPELFTTGVMPAAVGRGNGRFKNAKPLYRLASTVHEILTGLAEGSKDSLYETLTLKDFGLWYLDDGSAIRRNDSKNGSWRFIISIGDCCNTIEKEGLFTGQLRNLFGDDFGRIALNNSKASENNKIWIMPHSIAKQVLDEARQYGVMKNKLPLW